jgi:hypothetical protein
MIFTQQRFIISEHKEAMQILFANPAKTQRS